MTRTAQLARLALLSVVVSGAAAVPASAITLADPATFDTYAGTPGPELTRPAVVTGDLNRDGKADAVGISGGPNALAALGTVGGLGSTEIVLEPFSSQAVALADVNRDGRSDMLRVRPFGLTAALGNGNGTFGVGTIGPNVGEGCATDIAAGDVNRDGHIDVVAVCPDRLVILSGDSTGAFVLGGTHALPNGISASRVVLADLNGDGRLDALTNDVHQNGVTLSYGVGDGTFGPANTGQGIHAGAQLAVADVDRNGALDIVGLSSGPSPAISLVLGRGEGLFDSPLAMPVPDIDAVDVALGDLDQDRRLDIVVAGRKGIVTLGGQGATAQTQTAAWATAIDLADTDGDGRLDVVLLDKDGDELQVARNVTPERTAPNAYERITPEPGTNNGPGYTTSADLDRDGVLDLIVAQQTASRVGIFLGNGDATLGGRGDYWAGGNSPTQIVPADMNRDGILDLVVGHGLNAVVGVVLGNGDGSFQTPQTQSMPSFSQSAGVAVGDFDRDGIADVATANDDGQRASVFRGAGDGTLGAPTNYSTAGGRAAAIVTADFDLDGKLDLAVLGSSFSPRLNLLRGNGDGTFQAATTVNLGSGSQPQALRAADLDRDGDLDLVTANYGNSTVSVLTNVGGGFASRVEFPAWGTPRGLDVGDVDGDRIPDVVFTDGEGDTVGLLRGGGDSTLATGRSLPVGSSPYGVGIADLDRDGRSEIAVPSYTGQTLAVLRGVVDTVAPSTSDSVPSGWSLNGRVTLTATDTGGAGVDKTYYTVGTDPDDPTTASSVYSTAVTLTDGQRIKYFSVDHAGNAEAVRTSDPIKVDGTAPVSSASFATDWQNAPVPVTLSATDAGSGSGVQRILYTVGTNPSTPGPSSAVYDPANKPTLTHGQRIRFRAQDVAGNVEASKPAAVAVKVDTAVPTVTDDVTDAWRPVPIPVTLTPADTGGSNVAATHYEIGEAPATPTTASPVYDPASKPALQDGQQIRYVTYDAAGNASAAGTSVAARVDAVAPTTTDDVPGDWRTASVAVTLDASDARSGVATTYYEIGVSPTDPTTASAVYDPSSKPLLQHGERIAYRSADVAGNLEDVRISTAAMVDETAPDAPTLLAGPPAADTATTASIAFAGEPDALFSCTIDGAAPAPCVSPLTLRDLAVGEHEVRIEQVDVVGFRSPALTVRFSVTAPPVEPPPVEQPPVEQPPSPQVPGPTPPAEPRPSLLRTVLGDADGAGRRPVVLVAGQSGVACAADRGRIASCRLEARSVRRLTTASGKRLPAGTVLATGSSAAGVAAGPRLATDLRLTRHGRAARATHPLGLTARLVVAGTAPDGTPARGSSLIRLMTSDTLVIPVAGRPRALSPSARLLLGRLVRTVGGQVRTIRCTADTDRSGDARDDRALTIAQARAACAYLRSRGVRAKQTSEGRGSTRPRASDRTARGRALNRRLTIRVTL
jgi:hypothetical protein